MRLGAYPCVLNPVSLAYDATGARRYPRGIGTRYEFNNEYREILGKHGLQFTGLSPDKNLVEIIELRDHPWFLGCQFHPEFKSRPMEPHPIFKAFVGKSLEAAKQKRPETFGRECGC